MSVHWQNLRIDFAYLLHYALPDSYIVSLSYERTNSLAADLAKSIRWFGNLLRDLLKTQHPGLEVLLDTIEIRNARTSCCAVMYWPLHADLRVDFLLCAR